MRLVLIAIVALAGCAHIQEAPLSISVEPTRGSCLEPLVEGEAHIKVTNTSDQKVSFQTYGESGPPFSLYPRAVQIIALDALAKNPSQWRVVLEELTPPDHAVTLGPGDHTEFVVRPDQWPTGENQGLLSIQVQDTYNQPHLSKALHVCHPGSA